MVKGERSNVWTLNVPSAPWVEFGNRRRQRSELRPHPKEEAMSHVLATVLRDGRSLSAIRKAAHPASLYESENSRSSTRMPLWRIIATLTPANGDDSSPISSFPSSAASRSSTSKAM